MWCGAGTLPQVTGTPVFASPFEVATVEEAVAWVSQFIDFGVVVQTKEQIQQDLAEKQWSRIGASAVFEYFLMNM